MYKPTPEELAEWKREAALLDAVDCCSVQRESWEEQQRRAAAAGRARLRAEQKREKDAILAAISEKRWAYHHEYIRRRRGERGR